MMPDDIFAEARRDGRLKETGVNMAVLEAVASTKARMPPALPGMEASEPGDKFEMELPWPPSVNDYYTRWVFGVIKKGSQWVCAGGKRPTIRAALSKDAEAFRQEVALLVGKVKPLTGPLMLTLVLHEPDKHNHDIDNFNKGLFDAITHAGVFHDDSQIKMLVVSYGPLCRPNGKVAVRIVPLTESA
jgi:crossover junction endodeoxyribonuclease RusA